MRAAQLILAALLLTACKNAPPQQLTPHQNAGPDAAAALDASTRPDSSTIQPPTAAAAPRSTTAHDAGRSEKPQAERRAREDAGATTTAKDSGAEAIEPVCVPSRDLPTEQRELEIAGLKRSFVVHVPAELPTDRAAPLLIDLHGLLRHARYQRANSGFDKEADRAGFVVAYPQALDNAWNLGISDCCGPDSTHDDVEFIRALVAKLQESACIDAKHIYVAGSDVGGGLAQQLACHASELFAAVVTRDFDLLEPAATSCQPSRPVPILAIRSEADPDLPYAGGEARLSSGLSSRVRTLGAEASLRRWAELNRCNGEPDMSMPNCQRYTDCKDSSEVALCRSTAQDAAAAWAFLKRF